MNIVVVGARDRQLELMLRPLATRVSEAASLGLLATSHGASDSADLLVVDIRDRADSWHELAAVRRDHPAMSIIVVATRLDPAMMLEAIRAGVNEFLVEPLAADDVRQALERVSALQPRQEQGRTYAFVGGKGGVGTTTLAVNVATAIAQSEPGRVLFVDLHPAHGDAALFFGAEPRFSVADAYENAHRLDAAFLKSIVLRTKGGVDLLASTDRSVVAPTDVQRARTLIDFVARHYAHVVIDVPRSDSAALDALEDVSKIIIVANQELATVKGAARMATTLRQRYGKERVQVVVSRYDTAGAIAQEDIERVTGGGIKHVFPSNYRIAVDALNRGCPIVVQNHNKLAGAFVVYARSLAGLKPAGREEPASKPAGLLGRLKGAR